MGADAFDQRRRRLLKAAGDTAVLAGAHAVRAQPAAFPSRAIRLNIP